jgi:2,4-dienoyl-CoA reductase (NADPH2)
MSISSAPASVIVCGQIADAEFAAKARAGHADDIRLCLSCNQECVGRMGLNRWLGCIENPVPCQNLRNRSELVFSVPVRLPFGTR